MLLIYSVCISFFLLYVCASLHSIDYFFTILSNIHLSIRFWFKKCWGNLDLANIYLPWAMAKVSLIRRKSGRDMQNPHLTPTYSREDTNLHDLPTSLMYTAHLPQPEALGVSIHSLVRNGRSVNQSFSEERGFQRETRNESL